MAGTPYNPDNADTPVEMDYSAYSGAPARTPGTPGTPGRESGAYTPPPVMPEQSPRQADQTRLCPTCRMPISVLATRCRHCGQDVARAKKPAETYTVKDLGGDAPAQMYEAPGSVTQALEAFRAEVSAKHEDKGKKGLFGRGKKKKPEENHPEEKDLPELDETSLDLASSLFDTPESHGRKNTAGAPVNRFFTGCLAYFADCRGHCRGCYYRRCISSDARRQGCPAVVAARGRRAGGFRGVYRRARPRR